MGLLDRLLGRKKTAPPAPPEPEPPPVILAANVQGIGGREAQEDSFALLNATNPEAMEREGLFVVLADGMGASPAAGPPARSRWRNCARRSARGLERISPPFWKRRSGKPAGRCSAPATGGAAPR